MKQILNAVLEHLKDNVASLKFLDENWGQLDISDRPSVKFPCALVDFDGAEWTNQGQHKQWGKARLRVVAAATPLSKQTKLDVLDILHEIHDTLHGWCPDGARTSRFIRSSTLSLRRTDGIRAYEMIYIFSFIENVTQSPLMPVDAYLKIDN